MEKRLLLAIGLSFLLLLVWQVVMVKKAPEPVNPAAQTEGLKTAPAEAAPQQKKAEGGAEVKTGPIDSKSLNIKQIAADGEEEIVVTTSRYRAAWTNKGAVLMSWKLHNHPGEKYEDLDLVPASAAKDGVFPFSLLDEKTDVLKSGLSGIKDVSANSAFYKSSVPSLNLEDGQKGELRFAYSDGKEIEIEKAFTFYGGRYDFDVAVTLRKNGQPVEPRVLWGPGIGNPSEAELKQRFGAGGGVSVLASTNLFRVDERKYNPQQSAYNFVTWAAYDDNYFASILVPSGGTGTGTASFLKADDSFFLEVSNPSRVFVGPKEIGTLTAFGHDAKKVVRFGFFGFITEILFWSITFIHQYIPNWGFAIIFLTIVIKIIFFPLTYSSTKSMAKMAELQPKVKALRAKYKKAKTDIAQRRQMNEEMMKLYKEHGVNPAGGCLPMLIQIPVFWGFFRLLVVGVEFRRSPWMLWIKDLSVHDPTYITPILMGVTQFISQKMTPTSADPSQARMMLIMPVVMTIFFMNFQSGLVLYWLTSNVLQIGQQYLMNKMMKKKKSESDGKRRKK